MINNQYKSMTVNERLYVSGLMDAFDKAVKESNIKTVVDILKKVEITDQSAINSILKNIEIKESF